jgi:hypothetical protein
MAERPTKLKLSIPALGATATCSLLWEKAPKTVQAIVNEMPMETICFHGRNSGDEGLLLMPNCVSHLPQDGTENVQTDHIKGGVYFGYEPAGQSYGGASPGNSCSEIAWFYGHAGQACMWKSEHGAPHNKPPFYREAVGLNLFAMVEEENNFFTASCQLQRKGEQKIKVWVE